MYAVIDFVNGRMAAPNLHDHSGVEQTLPTKSITVERSAKEKPVYN